MSKSEVYSESNHLFRFSTSPKASTQQTCFSELKARHSEEPKRYQESDFSTL
ncbi:hypothetical protein THOG10_400021 [Vibrio rotiferianus]|nr:hypothetical protein THOG10_400021 [Vibrio rotiferianus]